jgi:hypothetical protein
MNTHMIKPAQFEYLKLPLELRVTLMQTLYKVNSLTIDQRNELLHNPTGELSRLTYLAWLKARNLINEYSIDGYPEWIADEGYVFDMNWYADLNEDHSGINLQATWDHYDLARILDFLK